MWKSARISYTIAFSAPKEHTSSTTIIGLLLSTKSGDTDNCLNKNNRCRNKYTENVKKHFYPKNVRNISVVECWLS